MWRSASTRPPPAGALVTVLADGRVALNNPAALPDDAPDDVYQHASEQLEATYAADVGLCSTSWPG